MWILSLELTWAWNSKRDGREADSEPALQTCSPLLWPVTQLKLNSGRSKNSGKAPTDITSLVSTTQAHVPELFNSFSVF